MTITQTVDIPENRRLTIEVPREVPTGRTDVIIQFPVQNDTKLPPLNNIPTEEALASARDIIEKHRPAFEALAK